MINKFLINHQINKYSKTYLKQVYLNILRYPNNYDKTFKHCVFKRVKKVGLSNGSAKQ